MKPSFLNVARHLRPYPEVVGRDFASGNLSILLQTGVLPRAGAGARLCRPPAGAGPVRAGGDRGRAFEAFCAHKTFCAYLQAGS